MIDWINHLDLKLLEDDPVRPHLTSEFRTSDNRNVLKLVRDGEVAAIVCVAFTNEVSTTEQELEIHSGKPTVAMFYTIWSYAPKAGQELINGAVEFIMLNIPSVKRFVTLSPKTEMARKFHFRNGAIQLQENTTTINYEYTLPTLICTAGPGMAKNLFGFMVNPNAHDSFEKNGEYFYENKYWDNYKKCYAEHPHYLLRLHYRNSPEIKPSMYKLQLKRLQKHKIVVLYDDEYTNWGGFLMNYKHHVNQDHYDTWNIPSPDMEKIKSQYRRIDKDNPAAKRHLDFMLKQLVKHDISHLRVSYHKLFVIADPMEWKRFKDYTNSELELHELVKRAQDYHLKNIEITQKMFPNVKEKLQKLLT